MESLLDPDGGRTVREERNVFIGDEWRWRAGLHQFRSSSTSSATDTYRARATGVSLHKHDSTDDYTSVALSLSAFIKMEFLKLPFIFLTGVPSIDLGAGCNSRPLNDSALGHSSWTVLR